MPYVCGPLAATDLRVRRKDEFLEKVSFFLGSAQNPFKYIFLLNGSRIDEIDEVPLEAEVLILGHSTIF